MSVFFEIVPELLYSQFFCHTHTANRLQVPRKTYLLSSFPVDTPLEKAKGSVYVGKVELLPHAVLRRIIIIVISSPEHRPVSAKAVRNFVCNRLRADKGQFCVSLRGQGRGR